MPTKCTKAGCRWGNQKLYKGKNAKAKANRQGRAIAASRARAGRKR
jgi:hypothetical protein